MTKRRRIGQRYRTKRVFANKVYQEYISDRHHIHMNATRWETLSIFVKHLGKTGQVTVDWTEKGPYIKYIDRDPAVIARQEAIKQKEKMAIDDEIRNQKRIEQQLKIAEEIRKKEESFSEEPKSLDESKSSEERRPISISLQLKSKSPALKPTNTQDDEEPNLNSHPPNNTNTTVTVNVNVHPNTDNNETEQLKFASSHSQIQSSNSSHSKESENCGVDGDHTDRENGQTKRKLDPSVSDRTTPPPKKPKNEPKKSALDEIKEQEERRREREGRKQCWLHPGIIVKIKSKDIKEGAFYGQKGVIRKVDGLFAVVSVGKDEIKVHQKDLETVIPAIGGRVLITNGAYRGETATLLAVHIERYKATVQIVKGIHKGHTLEKDYEDICKLSTE
jgi:DNA/RNA-binding protein KIN17